MLQSDGVIYPELIESFVRKSLNKTATRYPSDYSCLCNLPIFTYRAMAVLDPVKVIITNFPYPEVRTKQLLV